MIDVSESTDVCLMCIRMCEIISKNSNNVTGKNAYYIDFRCADCYNQNN